LRKKIIYVFSNIQHSLGFEWLGKYMDASRYETIFVFLNPGYCDLQKTLEDQGHKTYYIKLTGKKSLPAVFFSLCRIFLKERPDIVHTHLFEASLTGIAAAWLCRVKKRIYTRHHSSFHHVDQPQAVKYDRLINTLSTGIIAVSGSVASVLKRLEQVPPHKIHVVHHGFELDQFESRNISADRIERLRGLYNPDNKRPVIGVISRYIRWKGLQHIIPAYKRVLAHHPDALLILANAKGSYSKEVAGFLKQLPETSYREIVFENDIFALYRLFDVFIHTPIREDAEAFGQIYIEAMAARVNIVASMAGIAQDILKHDFNAMVVPFEDENAIYKSILELLANPGHAENLRNNAYHSIQSNFTVQTMIKNLEAVYEE
jgi:glycosyltransferase involved in cell wall biosynthesis